MLISACTLIKSVVFNVTYWLSMFLNELQVTIIDDFISAEHVLMSLKETLHD